jgi:hypothetical protein
MNRRYFLHRGSSVRVSAIRNGEISHERRCLCIVEISRWLSNYPCKILGGLSFFIAGIAAMDAIILDKRKYIEYGKHGFLAITIKNTKKFSLKNLF